MLVDQEEFMNKIECISSGDIRTSDTLPKGSVEVKAIEDNLNLFYRPDNTQDGVIEIRFLPGAHGAFCQSPREAAELIVSRYNSNYKGAYFMLNSLKKDKGNGIWHKFLTDTKDIAGKDTDIVQISWLLVDFDPNRPANTNSSEAEKKLAGNQCTHAINYLTANGFAEMIVADSGNGYHILIPVRMPNNDETKQKRKDFLLYISSLFKTDAIKVDLNVFNAGRITKAYGTWTRKGPHSDERPQRKSKILGGPKDSEGRVRKPEPDAHYFNTEYFFKELDKYKAIQSKANESKAAPPDITKEKVATPPAREAATPEILKRASKYICEIEDSVQGNNGSGTCFKAACKLVQEFALSREEALQVLNGEFNKNKCHPPWSYSQLEHKVDDAIKNIDPSKLGILKKNKSSTQQPIKLKLKRLSEFKMEPIKWVVSDRKGGGFLSAGLNMLVGQSGLGKSTFTRYLAAVITMGGAGGFVTEQGEVLFLCYEDDVQQKILPHIVSCGGDPTKIHMQDGCVSLDGKDSSWNATQLDLVAQALKENPNIKIVVVDVLTTLTAETNASTNDADQTRAILGPLNKMGQEHGVAVLLLHHPNKHGTTARTAIAGSNQLAACARIVWQLGPDSEQEDVRLVACVKRNFDGVSDGISFRDRQVDRSVVEAHAAKFGIIVPSEIKDEHFRTIDILDTKVPTADELLNPQNSHSAVDKCAKWLVDRLKGGERVLSDTVQKECECAGFSFSTFKRAKDNLKPLGLQVFKDNEWFMAYTPSPFGTL